VTWFLSAGSCKITATDFVKANGYNPDFVGWGDEDVEFYHRLSYLGSDLREWHRIPESRQAVAINLEWPELSDDEALAWSKRYFAYETSGPRFVSYRCPAGVGANSSNMTSRRTFGVLVCKSEIKGCGIGCGR
jgi:N-terminal domain of galactosyltransferase